MSDADAPGDDGAEVICAPAEAAGMRLDTFLARRQNVHSRTYFQQLVKDGRVTVEGAIARPSAVLSGGEAIVVDFPPAEDPWPHPQDIPIDVLYDDEDLVVINKAAGMIVHPAAGNPDGTLVNALLHRFPDLPGINGVKRPGIVHRLDRETSGVMVVAKTDRAMNVLANALKDRRVRREYAALLIREPDWEETTVDVPIGRHDTFRIRRAVNGVAAKNAITHMRVILRARGFALVRCRLSTGRTHQIRVHCEHLGMPIAGDSLYGGAPVRALEKLHNADASVRAAFQRLSRPLLHARRLRFVHPTKGGTVEFLAPFPDDYRSILLALFPNFEPEDLMRGDDDEATP